MIKPRKFIGIAVVAAASLAVGGCSDDDEAATSTTQASEASAPESAAPDGFVEEANALCIANSGQIGALFAGMGAEGEPTPEQLQETLDEVVSLSRDLIDDLEAVTPPTDIEEDYAAMLAQAATDTDEAEAQGLAFFETEDDPWAETNEMARDLGLDGCAGGG